jgi:SAM-dependent methyltransferase
MWRRLYYLIPAGWRHWARYIYYLPADLIAKKSHQLLPPQRLIYTGRGDFIKQGQEWLNLFIAEGGLLPIHSVLDIGSGIGRIALPMMDYLLGEYQGFDAVKTGVDWCQKHISSRKANFKFQYIDLHNDLYNSKGIRASEFVFPYPNQSFDFVCAISVFTHLQLNETENYIHQIKRVLKPGGKAVITFFLLDKDTLGLMETNPGGLRFKHHYPNYSLLNHKVRAANVAYQRSYIYSLLETSGFKIKKEIKGSWCGRGKKQYLDFQDILLIYD